MLVLRVHALFMAFVSPASLSEEITYIHTLQKIYCYENKIPTLKIPWHSHSSQNHAVTSQSKLNNISFVSFLP